MKTDQELKDIVKEKYAEIAHQSKEQNETTCWGSTCGCGTTDVDQKIFSDDYTNVKG